MRHLCPAIHCPLTLGARTFTLGASLLVLGACGSTPATATGGSDIAISSDVAATDTTAGGKDAGTTDTAGGDAATADQLAKDSAVPDSAVPDSAADTAVADAAKADTGAPDGVATDTAPADVAAQDSAGADSGSDTAVDITVADAGSSDVSAPPPGNVGACSSGAPGYDSCFTQAFIQCLQPGATCEAVTEPQVDGGEIFTTTWSNGSKLVCVTAVTGSDGSITCNGSGPDGKACLQYIQKFKGEMPAGTSVTGPNGTHTLSYDAQFKVAVTCSSGKVENYDKPEALCYPLQAGVCETNIGPGG
ncbi:MAG: hypothetical protein HY902_18780 [Deltaproteobacteria bacterium]|nr:hypothetical protein [Deltaproteobacteria bacterium]